MDRKTDDPLDLFRNYIGKLVRHNLKNSRKGAIVPSNDIGENVRTKYRGKKNKGGSWMAIHLRFRKRSDYSYTDILV